MASNKRFIRPVLLRKHLPTRTFRCHQPPHHCGVLEPFPLSGGCGFVVPPGSHGLWKVRLRGAFTIPREILGLSQRDYIWTLLVTSTLTDHEGTTIIVYISRKGLTLIHLPRKKVGMMTEVTNHSQLCRRHETLCFHEQAQLTILTLTCGCHQRTSRS